jgi:hypothetical protein
MIKVKTRELTGAALDWAVAQTFKPGTYWESKEFLDSFHPSTDWSDGGPIIEREQIYLLRNSKGNWVSIYKPGQIGIQATAPLIAAMRCYVVSKIGDEVEIPKELC